MSTTFLLVLAVLTSIVIAGGYRIGGRRSLWGSALAVVIAFQALAIWDRSRGSDEGPLWLTIIGTAVVVGSIATVIDLAASKQIRPALQVLMATITGVVTFFVVGFIGYMILVYFF